MSNYFICCEECFEKIGKRNTKAAKIWMDFCSLSLSDSEIIRIKPDFFNEIRELERLGFIVSIEEEDCIAVRVKGYIRSEDGEHFFCVKEGQHE